MFSGCSRPAHFTVHGHVADLTNTNQPATRASLAPGPGAGMASPLALPMEQAARTSREGAPVRDPPAGTSPPPPRHDDGDDVTRTVTRWPRVTARAVAPPIDGRSQLSGAVVCASRRARSLRALHSCASAAAALPRGRLATCRSRPVRGARGERRGRPSGDPLPAASPVRFSGSRVGAAAADLPWAAALRQPPPSLPCLCARTVVVEQVEAPLLAVLARSAALLDAACSSMLSVLIRSSRRRCLIVRYLVSFLFCFRFPESKGAYGLHARSIIHMLGA